MADEIAEFTRLFEARRAAEAAGGERPRGNTEAMNALVPAVQRGLERAGRSWVTEPEGGRPTPVVHLLAFGPRSDYERHAVEAIAALRATEAGYRHGQIAIGSAHRRGRRWPVSVRSRSAFRLWVAVVTVVIISTYTAVLTDCGVWDAPEGVPSALTGVEHPF